MLALTQNRWKSARKNNNHIRLPTVIISCGFAVSASSAVYSQPAGRKEIVSGTRIFTGGGAARPPRLICRRRRRDTLNFVFTCLCGFTDRLFHYACFLCRKIQPENNNHKNTSHATPCFYRTCTHMHTTHIGTPTHARMNKYNNIICTYIVISYIFYSGLREYTLSRYVLLYYICGGYNNNNNNENMCFSPS